MGYTSSNTKNTSYTAGNTSSDWNTIVEPPSAADAQEGKRSVYPYNNTIQSESGHSFELDDTPERERIRMHHRDGTFIEMHPKGDEVHKIYGDGYEIVLKNKKVKVYGSCTIVVDGDAAIEVKGDSWSSVKGNYTAIVNGNANITSKGDTNITADKELKICSGEDIEVNCKSFNLTGDLYVQGDIGCNQSITADGNITAMLTVVGILSIRSPGALFVGPIPALYPTLFSGVVDIIVPGYIRQMSMSGPFTEFSGSLHSTTAVGFIQENAGLFIQENAGTFIQENAGLFIQENAKTFIQENAGLFIQGNAGTFIQENAGLFIQENAKTFIQENAGGIINENALVIWENAAVDIQMDAGATISLITPLVTHFSAATVMTGVLTVTLEVITLLDFVTPTLPSYLAHIHMTDAGPTTPPIPGT